ncbi:hypothetical protein IAT38_007552 [Cryptococcus sp. DSM 104549]
MFANITPQGMCDEAFFSLLDEYFESRPHLVGGAAFIPSATHATYSNGAVSVPTSTLARFLPPSSRSPAPTSPPPTASPSSSSHYPPPSPTSSTHHKENPDMAQKFISGTIKYGTKGTKGGVGALSRNKDAMDLLGKVGAAGMVRGANDRLNKPQAQGEDAGEAETGASGKKAPAPPPTKKKGGVSGLVSSRSFGHVDTSSKMGAFTSMWKDPQKAQAPVVEHHAAPALSHSHSNLPPPVRRDASGSRSPPVVVPAETAGADLANGAEGQAQALYDYTGADTGDLSVQANQIVNIIEKTSDDWWTCEDGNGARGLVPSSYLKQI